jgi:hypothetical protein
MELKKVSPRDQRPRPSLEFFFFLLKRRGTAGGGGGGGRGEEL